MADWPVVTLERIKGWDCCWDLTRMREVTGHRDAITAEDAVGLAMGLGDKLWFLFKPELVGVPTLVEFIRRSCAGAIRLCEAQREAHPGDDYWPARREVFATT